MALTVDAGEMNRRSTRGAVLMALLAVAVVMGCDDRIAPPEDPVDLTGSWMLAIEGYSAIPEDPPVATRQVDLAQSADSLQGVFWGSSNASLPIVGGVAGDSLRMTIPPLRMHMEGRVSRDSMAGVWWYVTEPESRLAWTGVRN